MSNLRVTIVGLNYAPEPTGNAPYTTKLAEGLRTLGHDVRVVTGFPHYPQWRVAERYSGIRMHEVINNVPVTRVRHTVPSRPKGLNRLIMELTFGFHAAFAPWGRPDVVLVVSPALFSCAPVALRARLTGKPSTIWVQDLYSRGLEETSGKRSSLTRAVKWIEGRILASTNHVSTIHERFRQYVVQELGLPSGTVGVIRNWTHVATLRDFDREAARKRYGWKPGETIALHAGNMGVKQGLENVVAAAQLADIQEPLVRFVLLGDGNRRSALQHLAEGVQSIEFLAPLDEAAYLEALHAADVLIVNEIPSVREMAVPSKLTSYFATGLPVVAATDIGSATAEEMRASGGGVCVNPGKPQDLLSAIKRVATASGATDYGSAGQAYAESVLGSETAIRAYTSLLKDLARKR